MQTYSIIIGNPPYQLSDGGHGASAKPIYHKFIQGAKALNPEYFSFIVPARWYTAGKGLDEFRAEMLSDTHISHLYDFPNSKYCFPEVDINGGVCYFLWDHNHNGNTAIHNFDGNTAFRPLNEFKWLLRINKSIPIVKKVLQNEEEFMNAKVHSHKPFAQTIRYAKKLPGVF